MSIEQEREPFNDPADLLDELDSIIREQQLLRLRVEALQARYRELEPYAERFDKPGLNEWSTPETFGSVNIESAVNRLDAVVREMAWSQKWLQMTATVAAKVQEYPRRQLVVDGLQVGRSR
ncbi:hypothetical protein ACWCPQ_21305 [Nocardia sp. NPDC001965]